MRNGDCKVIPAEVIVLPLTGSVTGSDLNAVAFGIDAESGKRFTVPFRATLSGTTIAFRSSDNTTIATMPQTSSTPPDSAASGSYGGTYNLLSANSGCTDPSLRSVTDSGPATGSIVQTGAHLYALLTFTDVREMTGPTNCVAQDKNVTLELVTLLLTGASVSGNGYNGTLNGTTLFLRTAAPAGPGFFEFTIVRGASSGPSISSFASNPTNIISGTATTLSWATINATAVSISGGVGSVAASGTTTVSPTTTTTYTLTATGPGGPAATATTTVTVTPPAPPANVVVAAFPRGMLQLPGSTLPASPYDSYTLKNIGGTATNITLAQASNFFVQTPTAFVLGPGASQIISIRSSPQAPGRIPAPRSSPATASRAVCRSRSDCSSSLRHQLRR